MPHFNSSDLHAQSDLPALGAFPRYRFVAPFGALLILSCAAIQIALGGTFSLVATLSFISATALFPFLKRAELSVSDIIFASIGIYNGTLAILIKSALAQPLQQNLEVPNTSALIILCGHCAVVVAWLFSAYIMPQSLAIGRIRSSFNSREMLSFFSKYGFITGYILAVLHIIFKPQIAPGSDIASAGFGGFGSLYFILVFSFASQCALAATDKSGSQTRAATAMFMLILFLSVAGNAKKYALDAGLIVLLTIIAFRLHFTIRTLISGLMFVLFIQFLASPLIHITRGSSNSSTITERVEYSFKVLRDNEYDMVRINEINERISKGYSRSYRSSGSYVYPSTLNLDRFALILPVDQVARTQEPGRVSLREAGGLLLQRILPGALIAKQPGVLTDHLAWAYGIRTYGSVARPVMGLTASTYAVAGFTGVLAINFVVMLAVFIALNLLGGALHRSGWAVGMIASVSLIAEMDMNGLVGLMVRDLPIMIVALASIVAIARIAIVGGQASSPLRWRD